MKLNIYKIGDIVVDTEYQKPTKEKFLKWREEFLNDIGHLPYDFVLRGNAAEIFYGNSTLETFDIDIFFSSQNKTNYEEIKQILETAILLGAKHKIFIDIFHVSKNVFNNFLYENFVMIRNHFNITYMDGEILHSTRRYKKIINGLFFTEVKNEVMYGYKKWKKRIDENQYMGLIIDLRTLENKNKN